jgi:hypothetical protein
MPKPLTPAQLSAARWRASEEDWTNGVLYDAPDSWDGDEGAESIALRYVATLEARLDAAGISREQYVGED